MLSENLESIHVVIASTNSTAQWDVSLPIDVVVQAIVAKLVSTPELNFRNIKSPRLRWMNGDRPLRETETLRDAQVQPNDTLILVHEATISGPTPNIEAVLEQITKQGVLIQRLIDMPEITHRPVDDPQAPPRTAAISGTVFVVHGHDDARKHELIRLLERSLVTAKVIVLHEQANLGATILEKLLKYAQAASFAVVLLTGDDEGRLRKDDIQAWRRRGRQNVIFELGMFIGLLGRSRVAVLKDPDVEDPSDLAGLVYIPLDTAGAWRHSLLREISETGIGVNFENIP